MSMSNPPLLKTQKVPVPEFGDGVEIALRGLTARQRWTFGQMASKASDGKSGPEPASYLIAQAAVGDDGKPLFQTQDCDVIAEWPGDLVDRISTVVMEMSGLSQNAAGDAKNDSSPTPSGDSLSDSGVSSDAPPTS
jgi:hypothetical protein